MPNTSTSFKALGRQGPKPSARKPTLWGLRCREGLHKDSRRAYEGSGVGFLLSKGSGCGGQGLEGFGHIELRFLCSEPLGDLGGLGFTCRVSGLIVWTLPTSWVATPWRWHTKMVTLIPVTTVDSSSGTLDACHYKHDLQHHPWNSDNTTRYGTSDRFVSTDGAATAANAPAVVQQDNNATMTMDFGDQTKHMTATYSTGDSKHEHRHGHHRNPTCQSSKRNINGWLPKKIFRTRRAQLSVARHMCVVPKGMCVVAKIMAPFLGTLNNRCRIIIGTQTGTLILTTTHK